MKNWKTTLGGFLLAAGAGLKASDDQTLSTVGMILIGVGGLIIGIFGKDNNVTGVGPDAVAV
jgi:hypothetical protein